MCQTDRCHPEVLSEGWPLQTSLALNVRPNRIPRPRTGSIRPLMNCSTTLRTANSLVCPPGLIPRLSLCKLASLVAADSSHRPTALVRRG